MYHIFIIRDDWPDSIYELNDMQIWGQKDSCTEVFDANILEPQLIQSNILLIFDHTPRLDENTNI